MSRFSKTVMEHFQEPRNRGPLPGASHVGVVGAPGRGPYFVLHLRVVERRIVDATFQCNACGATIACGSVLTELLKGRPIDDFQLFATDDLLHELGGLPPDKLRCAATAIESLRQALPQEPPEAQ